MSVIFDYCFARSSMSWDYLIYIREHGICIAIISCDFILTMKECYTGYMVVEDFMLTVSVGYLLSKYMLWYVIFCIGGNVVQGIQLHPHAEYRLILYEDLYSFKKGHNLCLSMTQYIVIGENIRYTFVIIEKVGVNLRIKVKRDG